MPDPIPQTIIARYHAHPGRWVATFDGKPQVAFGGDMSVVSIRRLLEGTEAEQRRVSQT
jgi:hypothetical protein